MGVTLDHTHSRSLMPLVRGDGNGREGLIYGTFSQGVCCTDGEWSIFKSPEKGEPLYYYSSMIFKSMDVDSVASPAGQGHYVPGVKLPQWRVPVEAEPLSWENFLFNRVEDPKQTKNLWRAEPQRRRQMLGLLRDLLAEEGAPEEQYVRLGLES